MKILVSHQLNIMLFLSGICFVIAVLTVFTKSMPRKRRNILARLLAAATFLLVFDRYAYMYRGDVSERGYWMVRLSNFLVFFLVLYIVHSITHYIDNVLRQDGKLEETPNRLVLCDILYVVGVALLVISQFTDLYYTFDAQNVYHRTSGYVVCYAMPFLIILLQLSVILQHRHTIRPLIVVSLVVNTIVPMIISIIQLFAYGLSLVNITIALMGVVLYIFVLIDFNEDLAKARTREIEFYKERQRKEHSMFVQTAEALVNAIEAKDKYTNGHSIRVALYSELIAIKAGKPEEECEKVFFAGLLHDVGKIGIADTIINKEGKLTKQEFEEVKRHPVIGYQILSSIKEPPYLSTGARYHHERYDGKGYPDGLKGEEIPEIARIISVADAYDAMTSNRSYRSVMPQDVVRKEIEKGIGTQFDPVFAKIMLELIDEDIKHNIQNMKDWHTVASEELINLSLETGEHSRSS